jgi:hypothetical protein
MNHIRRHIMNSAKQSRGALRPQKKNLWLMDLLFSGANLILYFIFLYSSTVPKYVQYQIKYTMN